MPVYPKWSLTLRFPHQNPQYASALPHTRYMPHLSHSSQPKTLDHILSGNENEQNIQPLVFLCLIYEQAKKLVYYDDVNAD